MIQKPDEIRDQALKLEKALDDGRITREQYFAIMGAVARKRDRALLAFFGACGGLILLCVIYLVSL